MRARALTRYHGNSGRTNIFDRGPHNVCRPTLAVRRAVHKILPPITPTRAEFILSAAAHTLCRQCFRNLRVEPSLPRPRIPFSHGGLPPTATAYANSKAKCGYDQPTHRSACDSTPFHRPTPYRRPHVIWHAGEPEVWSIGCNAIYAVPLPSKTPTSVCLISGHTSIDGAQDEHPDEAPRARDPPASNRRPSSAFTASRPP
jgi:hypothetical protein